MARVGHRNSIRWTLAGLGAAATLLAARPSSAADDWRTRLPAFPRYDATEVVERIASPGGAFVVNHSLSGRNAVPRADADADGVPDFVQMVARTLDEALVFYRDRLGLRRFLDPAAGAPPFDAFLVDFSGRGDGQFVREGCPAGGPKICGGLLLLENDFAGYRYGTASAAVRTVASHELFHAVQAAYGADEHVVFSEGGATWASEAFDGRLDDFERAITGYLAAPEQPLSVAPPGPVSAFTYGSGLFFRFLSERFGDAVMAALLAESAVVQGTPPTATPPWLAAAGTVLPRDHAVSFASAFADFAIWNALTGSRGGAGSAAGAPVDARGAGYREAARYPVVTTQPRAIPFVESAVRLFPAAARVFSLSPLSGPGPLRARVAVIEGAGPVDVAIIGRQAGLWSVQGRHTSEAAAPDGVIDPGTDPLIVISNGALAGASTRVHLCVGRDDLALAPCAMAAMPPPPVGPGAASDTMTDGGGCRAVPGNPGRSASTSFCLVMGVLMSMRLARGRRAGRVS